MAILTIQHDSSENMHCLTQKKLPLGFKYKQIGLSLLEMVRSRFSNTLCLKNECFLNILNDQVIPSLDFFFPYSTGTFHEDTARMHRAHTDREIDWPLRLGIFKNLVIGLSQLLILIYYSINKRKIIYFWNIFSVSAFTCIFFLFFFIFFFFLLVTLEHFLKTCE